MTRPALTAAAAAFAVVSLGFSSGGYFSSDWGVLLLAATLVSVAALVLAEPPGFGRLDITLVGALGGLAAWQALSVAWSPGADGPLLEAQRTLVYAVAAGAVLLVLTRDTVPALLAGVAAGAVILCLYALLTRLVPDRVGDPADAVAGLRLDEPFGYANALGILAALAVLLVAGSALASTRRKVWVAASATLIPLTAVLWLTLSRGAMVALGAGTVVLVVLARDRRRALAEALVLAVFPVLTAVLTARSDLTDPADSLPQAEARGRELAWQLVLLVLVAASTAAWGRRLAEQHARTVVRTTGAMLGGVVAVVLLYGPIRLVEQASESFRAQPPVTEQDLNRRLLTLSGSWRADYWRVAWRMVEREPLLGEGGGSFERWWLQERPVASYARDAHNLYLETLAELGPVGLALLSACLAAPLLALRQARRARIAAGAAAAYTAFLVHAGIDWDWELPLVTLPAVACGAALVVLARPRTAVVGRRGRALGVAAAAALLAAALVMHVGNRALDEGAEALARGDDELAAARARRARTWLPWTAASRQLLGEAQLSGGDRAEARESLGAAIRRDPERWSAWYDLAVAATGKARAAALARAQRLNPLGPEIAQLREELVSE